MLSLRTGADRTFSARVKDSKDHVPLDSGAFASRLSHVSKELAESYHNCGLDKGSGFNSDTLCYTNRIYKRFCTATYSASNWWGNSFGRFHYYG